MTESLAVANSSRSVISEQFRALRTNLSFYLKEDEEKVVLVTSSMSGEGKSFVSINLGHILALSGKRVLLMELDLRKPGLATKLGIENNIGFTNFVISSKVTAAEIIKPLSIHENLFMISSGPIPPNPAETLMTSRTRVLVDELKQQFDYIIMDAPPVGLVTDAQLLSPYADICLYLVRQNYTLKEQLSIINELNDSKRMSKLGIVVNDIKANKEYGSGYGGSYVYGNYGE
jgi:tyrosine-protein kinase Etk/Wzc